MCVSARAYVIARVSSGRGGRCVHCSHAARVMAASVSSRRQTQQTATYQHQARQTLLARINLHFLQTEQSTTVHKKDNSFWKGNNWVWSNAVISKERGAPPVRTDYTYVPLRTIYVQTFFYFSLQFSFSAAIDGGFTWKLKTNRGVNKVSAFCCAGCATFCCELHWYIQTSLPPAVWAACPFPHPPFKKKFLVEHF